LRGGGDTQKSPQKKMRTGSGKERRCAGETSTRSVYSKEKKGTKKGRRGQVGVRKTGDKCRSVNGVCGKKGGKSNQETQKKKRQRTRGVDESRPWGNS